MKMESGGAKELRGNGATQQSRLPNPHAPYLRNLSKPPQLLSDDRGTP
jgi:hypothetical protein